MIVCRPRPWLLLGLAVSFACAVPKGTDHPEPSGSASGMATSPALDGTLKSLVVVGYSTSYAWPGILQDMLDEHSDGARLYHVLNAVVGGSPVGRWIAPPDSEDYGDTYEAMLLDFFEPDARLRGDAPAPTVALLQQSLQRTPTPATRLGPITSADDAGGIRIGADALARLAGQLRSDGIERVYIAMHIYKEGYEPEVGNERWALEELLRREAPGILAGPDLWSATIREHPAAFTEDRLHPNELGAKIMAEAWYRALAGDGVRAGVIEAMRERTYDWEEMMEGYLAFRRGDTEPLR